MKKVMKAITLVVLVMVLCFNFVGCTLSQEQLLKNISSEANLIKKDAAAVSEKAAPVGNLKKSVSGVIAYGADYSATSEEITKALIEFGTAVGEFVVETTTLAINITANTALVVSVDIQIKYIQEKAKEITDDDIKIINAEYQKLLSARKELDKTPANIETSYNSIKGYFDGLSYKDHITVIVPTYKEIVKNMKATNTQLDICIEALGKINTTLLTYAK